MELTLELSQRKWPSAESLGALFDANLPAMLALPAAALFGGVRCEASPVLEPPRALCLVVLLLLAM